MAVNIRKSKQRKCDSCESNGGIFYDIGIGPTGSKKQVITLCSACMVSLLEKMIKIGRDSNGV